MGVSVPLKLKDSAGLQSFDSDDYDFLAYRTGLQIRQSDSSDAIALTRFDVAGQKVFDVGTLTNTVYDSDVGTGGDTALLSTTSIASNVYRNVGTDSDGSLETYHDSNYANLLYQTDSASQQELVAFSDSDWTVVNNEILSRIYKYDYVGSVRLASAVTDFDSANGGWSNILPNFFSDTRTTDSATDSDISYSIFQKIDMTGIGVPSDSAKPFTMKYRADSAEISIAGAFKDIGRDSDSPYSKGRYYPSSTGVLSNTGLNRVAMAFTSLNSQQEFDSNSNLTLALDKEWNDKIYGVWQQKNGPAGRGPNVPGRTQFGLRHPQQTQYYTEGNTPNYVSQNHSNLGISFVYKDSVGDTLANRIGSRPQVWLGVKGRVDLVDSARFGSDDATFAATDATMQSYVESDGKWSFQFNFDSNASFQIRRILDLTDHSPNNTTQGVTYVYDSEGVANFAPSSNHNQYADVAILRPGYNYLQFPSPDATNKACIITDSSTTAIIKQARSNGHFANLLSSIPTNSNFKGIGYDSADEINLIFKNDFLGFQIADSDKLDETIGTRVRNHISSDSDAVGSIKILSASEGDPHNLGYTGTWISKGTATDTRKSLVDTNYTRTRSSSYQRIRVSEFTTDFDETYSKIRTSNYSLGFVGNYSREYVSNRSSEYITTFTRNRFSTFARVFQGNFTGNYEGNYSRNFAGNFTGNFTVSETNPTSDIPSQGFASNDTIWNYKTESQTAIARVQYFSGGPGPANYQNLEIYVDGSLVISGGGAGDPTANTYYTGPTSGTFYSTTGRAFTFGLGQGFELGTSLGYSTSSLYTYYKVVMVGTQTADYTRTSTRTSSRNYSATYLRVSTRSSLVDVTQQFIGNYSRSFSRNFEGNYSRNFSRTRAAFFSRDFEGNFEGNYSRNFEGNFVTSYTGNFTGPPSGTSYYYRLLGQSGTGPGTGTYYWSITDFGNASNGYSIAGGYDSGVLATTWAFLQGPYPTLSAARAITQFGPFSGYYYFRGSLQQSAAFDSNGNMTQSENYKIGRSTTTTNYTRTSTTTSIRISTRNFTNISTTSRTSQFLAGDTSFSRTFEGNYLGNYTGDFSREFVGNYSRNFVGDYAGASIGTTNTTIQTYTLYVKVG